MHINFRYQLSEMSDELYEKQAREHCNRIVIFFIVGMMENSM